MQVTGQILSVTPRIDSNTNAQMSWSGHGKMFYTFDMVVQGPNGQVSGEINSTSQGVYPKAAGEQITVEPYTQNGYPKLKAISDQNRQSQPQQQPQQGFYQQHQQQAPPPQQTPPSQQPPQDNVQDRIQFAQALNLAVSEFVNGKIEEFQIKERARVYYHVLKSRAFPLSMSNGAPPTQPEPQQQPSPQFDPNAAFDPTDDIPF